MNVRMSDNPQGFAHKSTISVPNGQHISVFAVRDRVRIYPDGGFLDLTPEQALEWAQAILEAADRAAEHQIMDAPDAGFDD